MWMMMPTPKLKPKPKAKPQLSLIPKKKGNPKLNPTHKGRPEQMRFPPIGLAHFITPCLGVSILICISLMDSAVAGVRADTGPSRAEAPRQWIDMKVISPGEVVRVDAGGDFQAALERAAPGDTIELEAGAVFQGPFVLPYKPHSDDPASQWITIRSGRSDTLLPPEGVRVSPADAAAMARLETATGAVVSTAPGAHHYRFVGIEFRPAASSPLAGAQNFLNTLISLGADEASGDMIPHNLVIERCYLHGNPLVGTRRGIIMNSASTAVIDSWLANFKMIGDDSQAIIGWEGPGPYLIRNNYLEAAGENLMFGGADPAIRDRVPADIEIRGNHFAKPVGWKAGTPDYAGTTWTIKNLMELKNARRVLVDGNLFEHNWVESQNGFAILFTVRNQDGKAPWSVVEDVTFSNNIVRHVANGINILGWDDAHSSLQTRRIVIRNNLFTDLGEGEGEGDLIQLLDGTESVVIEQNTAIHKGNILKVDGLTHGGFEFRDNIVFHNQYGIAGTDTAPGNAVFQRYFTDAVVHGNLVAGGSADAWPAGNHFPKSLAAVQFMDAGNGDFRVTMSSPYRIAGRAAGVDFAELCSALSVTEQPPFCPTVSLPSQAR